MSGFDLVVVSNRGPFTLRSAPSGAVEVVPAAGGMAPSLSGALAGESLSSAGEALWVASALTEADRLHASAGAVATGQELLEAAHGRTSPPRSDERPTT